MSVSDAPTPTRAAATSERRPITVLFADIAGSTSIAERMDPEDWASLVGEAFQRMNRTIERYGGSSGPLKAEGRLPFLRVSGAPGHDTSTRVRSGLPPAPAQDETDGVAHP